MPAEARPRSAPVQSARLEGDDALRLQVGFAGASGGAFCPYGPGGPCAYDYAPFHDSWFVVGADYDHRLSGGLSLNVGAHLLAAPYLYSDALAVEPSVGITYAFRHLSVPIVPRLSAGIGLYLGSAAGAALRLGAGATFAVTPRVGLAADLVLEAGSYGGYGFSALQVLFGPEFRL